MGLLIALPSGPVSFLIIRRFYLFGIRTGLYSVVGSLITDLFYITVVGFGLTAIQKFLGLTTGYAEVIAGVIILISGYRIMKEQEKNIDQEMHQQHPFNPCFNLMMTGKWKLIPSQSLPIAAEIIEMFPR